MALKWFTSNSKQTLDPYTQEVIDDWSGIVMGLSTDTKPVSGNSSLFFMELDTGKRYVWNGSEWVTADTPPTHTHTADDISDASVTGKALLKSANVAAALAVLGIGAIGLLGSIGTSSIDDDAVTYAKIQNVADARLLGHNSGGAGDMQEIVLGTNLSFSGTTLNATGGGGGAWGDITGTLSDQIDLQAALDAKQGADADLTDLADGSLTETAIDAAITRDSEAAAAYSVLAHTHGAATLDTDSVSADELNATGVEAELEAVLDLESLQGAVTDGQVPDTITVNVSADVSCTGCLGTTEIAALDAGDITTGAFADAQIPNTITIDLATTATTANAGDSATSFFASGTLEDARLSANVSLLGSIIGGAELGNPAVGTKGGIEAKTCSGTDKISAIGIDGIPICSTDQTAAAGDPFPVGSVFISVVSTNPNTLLGYGTWSAIGAGRVLVGLDSGDTDFDVAEETGGAKTVTLDETMIPGHTHSENAPSSASSGALKFAIDTNASGTQASGLSTGSTGGGLAHPNVQPYLVVHMWRRDS